MKIITDSIENINRLVADRVTELVSAKPNANIAFAAGDTVKGIYALLSESGADFSGVHAFNICEYKGGSVLADEVKEELYSKLKITNIHKIDENDPEAYDDEIAASGGLDLIILGMGLNGHIGFNEPATLFDTKTHEQQLTDSTKRMKAKDFGGLEQVPDFGLTMGLKTICGAKNVILCAFGAEKADIVYKLVYGKTTTYVPAAMLQMHRNMTLCLDPEAAQKL